MISVRVMLSFIMLLLMGCSTLVMANQGEPESKIKLYTYYGNIMVGINEAVDVSMVINGQLMILKNHPSVSAGDSYVEVERSLDYQEITQAKFTWLNGGKKYQCTADDLPLYVQEGSFGTGTSIHFDCK
jgi:hypothetical protein